MATPFYSQQQREYWVKRPVGILQFMTVEFQHPDFGFVRLVSNNKGKIITDRKFDVNGTLETFKAVAMEVPRVTNQESDSTKAGTISFGRIGIEFRKTLMMITPLGAITDPITTRLRQYQENIILPIYERRLYVAKNGISIGSENVNVRLSVDNPAKLTQENSFYDPATWIGLKAI